MPKDDETRTRESSPAGGPVTVIVSCASGVSAAPLPAGPTVVIGRGESCDLVLQDDSVSRRHAQLSMSGGAMAIEDLGSRNGTVVGGSSLAKGDRAGVALGSVIELGSATLVLQRAPPALPPRIPRRPPAGAAVSAVVVCDPTMERLYALLDVVAPSPLSVLVLGETGTGKEVFAEAIHARSGRAGGPMVRLNCAALAESVLESELFGHEQGAFTGAVRAKAGLFEAASGGTLFLDEVGELTPATQAKLLRALESGEVTRVGSVKPVRVDVRFVAATNRDLAQLAGLGQFRADLYFRLNGFSVTLPPLRRRRAEVVPLATHFLERAHAKLGSKAVTLSAAARSALERHRWPGNVRELRSVIERAAVLCRSGEIDLPDLAMADAAFSSIDLAEPAPTSAPPPRAPFDTVAPPAPIGAPSPARGPLRDELKSLEKERILAALTSAAGNQSQAAKILGMSRYTLIARIHEYGIARPRKR